MLARLSWIILLFLCGTVHAQTNITRIEYYIDTDPGFGNAASLSITPATNLQDLVIPLNPNTLLPGAHRLFIRALDANGAWSHTNIWLFYKPYGAGTAPPPPAPPVNITRVEYYIDNDPGFGNAVSLNIAAGTDLQDVIIAVDPSLLTAGSHRIHVRARDAAGNWGLTNVLLFFKPHGNTETPPLPAPPVNITRIEYYIDNDPGAGNATALPFTPGTDLADLVIPVDPTTLSQGNHALHIRARDANGKWSMLNTLPFSTVAPSRIVIGALPDSICAGNQLSIPFTIQGTVNAGNNFIAQLSDSAGSFNNPVTIGTVTGNSNDTIHAVIPVNAFAGSNYRLRVLTNSPADTIPVNRPIKIIRLPEAAPVLSNAGTTLHASALPAGAAGYHWYRNNVLITNFTGSPLTGATPGVYTVHYINACGEGPVSNAVTITGNIQTQTIQFPAITDKTYTDAAFILQAGASSGLTVSYAVTSGPARVSNDTLYINGAGAVTVEARQEGNAQFEAAPRVSRSFTVTRSVQTIHFDSISNKVSGNAPFALHATSASGLPVYYVVVSGLAHLLNNNLIALDGAGFVTIRAVQQGNQNYLAVSAEQTFCVSAPAPATITGFRQACNLAATSYRIAANPGAVYTWTLSGGGSLVRIRPDSVVVNWTTTGSFALSVVAGSGCDTITRTTTIQVQVADAATPQPVTELFPVNESVIASLPFTLSWRPALNALLYDVYIWRENEAEPSTPVIANTGLIGANVYARMLPGLAPGNRYRWKVTAKNACREVSGTVQTFSIPNIANLVVENVQTPLAAFSGQTIDVSFQVRNRGNAATGTGEWLDYIYLSRDTILHVNSGDYFLGAVPNISALDPGENYTSTATVPLPEDFTGTGYLLVVSNGYDRDLSPGSPVPTLSETSQADNINYNIFQVNLSPQPDLQVIEVITVGETFSGNTIPLRYTVTNRGNGSTKISRWNDAVYLSADPVLDIRSARRLAEIVHRGILHPDSSYKIETTVKLPTGIFGDYYLFVEADYRQEVFEYTFDNNNNQKSDPVTVFLTPTADLTTTDIAAPATAVKAQQVRINWTVINQGINKPDSTEKGWQDAVYISKDPVFNINNAVLGATVLPLVTGDLQPGDSYSSGAFVTIPPDYSDSAFLYVFTDFSGKVNEYNNENNNIGRVRLLINKPDLEVTAVTTPDTAASGKNMAVSWTIRNNGPGALVNKLNYDDKGWLSPTPVFNRATAISLPGFSYVNTLEAGASVTTERTITIPEGLSGTWYLFIQTNYGARIDETDTANNRNLSSAIHISLSPAPDLETGSFILGDDSIYSDHKIAFRYQVINRGQEQIIGRSWVDKIYLSRQPVWSRAASALVTTITRIENIPADGSYTVSDSLQFTVNMLNNLPAPCYLYVVTDADSVIYEQGLETNNVRRSDALTPVRQAPPDLATTAVYGVADTVWSGKPSSLSWTAINYGNTTGTYSVLGLWYDGIFLSRDTTWDANDLFVTDDVLYGPLQKNETYQSRLDFIVPDGLSGNYYVFMVVDHTNLQRDPVRGNNAMLMRDAANQPKPVYIRLSTPVDLVATGLQFATPAIAGQPLSVSWTVRNNGPGATEKGGWADRIYIGRGTSVDNTAIYLQNYSRTGDLAPDSSYTVTAEVMIPVTASGNYYLLVRTDENKSVYEHLAENNNTASAFIFIEQPLPADLTVQDLNIPALAVSGDSIDITWAVKNIGENPSRGYFREGVYLSADTGWSADDLLLGSYNARTIIAASGELMRAAKVKIKGAIVPGDYYMIIRTDLGNNIIETNEENNNTASTEPIRIVVNDLPVNVLTSTLLETNNERYYKVDIQDSLRNEAMMISLVSDSLQAVNELYVSYGRLPTRTQYDFAFSKPFSSSQDIVIPELQTGTYYVLIHGATATQQHQPVSLLARKINFEVHNVHSKQGGNSGAVTVRIDGAKFEKNMQAQLSDPVLGTIRAHAVHFTSSTSVFASFNLSNAAIGVYDITLIKPGKDTTVSDNAFTVVTGTGGYATGGGSNGPGFYCSFKNIGVEEMMGLSFEHPAQTRTRRVFPITIHFGNSGNVDILVPTRILLSVSGDPLSFTPEGVPENRQELYIEFKELNGPPGILRPGATGSITVYTQALSRKNLVFKLLE